MPAEWRFELRDNNNNLIDHLERTLQEARWSWLRVGGAGPFDILLRQRFDDTDESGKKLPFRVNADYDLQIYFRPSDKTAAWKLWYRGLVDSARKVLDDPEGVRITGIGYVTQLNRVIIDSSFVSKEISQIVKDIMNNDVIPKTDLTFDAGDIQSTGFTVDAMTFKTTALNAIATLADLAGGYEWGIDENRKLFFKARSTTITQRFVVGGDISRFDQSEDWSDVINVVLFEGGVTGGSTFTRTITDNPSIAKFDRRERIIVNAAITTTTVADRFGQNIIDEHQSIRRSNVLLRDRLLRLEDNIPIGAIQIMPSRKPAKYGTVKYAQERYSGIFKHQLVEARYELTRSEFRTSMDLGLPRPAVSRAIRRLAVDLDFLRAVNVQ